MNTSQKSGNILYVIIFFLFACNGYEKKESFALQQGDLLFQNTGTSEVDKAIKDVTATSAAKNYTHVGMAMQNNGDWFVLEAIPKEGVCQTPLKDFLNRNKNDINKSQTTVARLDSFYQPYISDAIDYGVKRLDLPYDDIFLWGDDAYYCSELVYKMFSSQDLPKEAIPFLTHPMTFNDHNGKPLPSWEAYYKERKQPIPEGDIGTNPNLMASSPHVKFVHDYEAD
jgi:hypothetical protein